MTYNVSLDTNELRQLSYFLMDYANSFEQKVHTFLQRLADVGIEVAAVNGGDFGSYITYTTKWDNDTTIKIVASSGAITSTWYAGSKSKETRTEVISPLLMAEFGSGHYAISNKNAKGLGGQGTLNKYGHAKDEGGWYWWSDDATYRSEDDFMVKSANGRWKFHSMGVHPAQPLHKAVMACIDQVEGIAREVFG